MKAMTTRQQLFGDLNRQLNARRRQMNEEIRGQILEKMSESREDKEKKEDIISA